MGIFTRVRDIISSNLNAMLDRAEDPEKLIRMMIHEMEDTLVEIKASCAGAMATKKKVERGLDEARARTIQWGERAQLAVQRGRDGLAREALMEKRRYRERAGALERELAQCDIVIGQYQDQITQLEDKLSKAREKQRILLQRHIQAQKRKQAQTEIRRMDSTDAIIRFEQFENRIERMEAEADLVNFGRKPTMEEDLTHLEGDEEIEGELRTLKASAVKKADQSPSS